MEKQKGAGHDRNNDLILPAMAKLETRPYAPQQFEGSLGKLTASSVHKPRQVLSLRSLIALTLVLDS